MITYYCINSVFIYISLYLCYLQEEHDDNYEAEAEIADEFDSDFNDDVFTCCLYIQYLFIKVLLQSHFLKFLSFDCFGNRSLSLMQQ